MDNIDLNKYFKGLKDTKGENIIENTPKDTETLKADIRYLEGANKLLKISKGDFIDLYAYEDVFIPYMGQALVSLGFSLKLPEGYMAKLYAHCPILQDAWNKICHFLCVFHGKLETSEAGSRYDNEAFYAVS